VNIRRTLPPAAAPLTFSDLARCLRDVFGSTVEERIKEEFREYFGTRKVYFVSSGKAALLLILNALRRLRNRRKIVVPAYTCYSVPSAILKAGFEVVPCDIEEHTLDFDYQCLSKLTDDDTLCVVPTHLFGIPSDMRRVREVCSRVGAHVVEDAAQAMGGVAGGRALGTIGDVGFFSLGRGKCVTSISGGVILTADEEISASVERELSMLETESFGSRLLGLVEAVIYVAFLHPNLYWLPDGLAFLEIGKTKFIPDFTIRILGDLKLKILQGWKIRLESSNRNRSKMGTAYADRLGLRGLLPMYSSEIPFLRFPVFAADPWRKEYLCKCGHRLGVSPMYPAAIGTLEQVRREGAIFEGKSADRVASTLVTLPTHEFVRERDFEDLCELVAGNLAEITPTARNG